MLLGRIIKKAETERVVIPCNKRRGHFRSSHREFFHINIDKYSALYLASKASAFLLYLFIYLLYNNRAINNML